MRHGNFCDRIFAFEVSAVLGEREVALEFEGWTVAEGGVEALGIVDGVDEEANGTPCVIDVPESATVVGLGEEAQGDGGSLIALLEF